MSHQKLLTKLEGFRSHNSANHCYINKDIFDSTFRRVRYVRYADDFLIGTISSKQYAQALKQEIKNFLEEVLHLRLSEEKTIITHARNEQAHFLGYLISRRFP